MQDRHQTIPSEILGDLQERVDAKVQAVSRHAYTMDKEENLTTSNLAQAIKDIAANFNEQNPDIDIEIYVEEFSLDEESRSGVDLYISIVRQGRHERISKGILVQSKRREKLQRRSERRRLRNQSNRMRTRLPDDSYVWIFDEDGTHCMNAPKSSDPKLRDLSTKSFSVGALIAEGVACWRGDETEGIEPGVDVPEALRTQMTRLSVPIGAAVVVTSRRHFEDD